MRLCFVIALIGLSHLGCMAQYYPAPPPIGSQKETELVQKLRSAKSDSAKIRIQLLLCNLYFNKPFKKRADLEKAMQYAREAAARSENLHDPAGYTNAELYMADIFSDWDEMSSAEKILPLVNDTAKINLLLMLSYKYRYGEIAKVPELEKAVALAQQARELSIRLHQPLKEMLALLDIAAAHVDEEKKGSEQEVLNVIGKYRSIGFPNLHYAYSELVQLGYIEGDYAKMIHYSAETIKSMKATGDSLAAGDFYNWYGAAYYQIGEFQKAMDYYRLAIESYALHAGEPGLAGAAFMYAASLRKMNRFPEALEFIQHTVKAYPAENVPDEITYNATIGNVYRDMKQYGKAAPYFLRVYELSRKQHHLQLYVDKELGELYVESHQYARARPFLNRALTAASTPQSRQYIHYLLYLVDSASGNYLAAMEHLHRNHKQSDSALDESRQKEIQKLLIQFETQKKEDSIKLKDQNIALLNQKATLQQTKLDKSALLIRITIGGVFLLLVIATLLYRQYRNKQLVNRVITQKNGMLEELVTEKEWLVKEVHHRVKNNLHTILCLLESQASHLKDEGLAAVEVSQHRIYAMSLIHQKLYQSEDIKTILMDRYIAEFVQYLGDSFEGGSQVHFSLEIEPVRLAVSQAIPVALIINEAVTNSMKYAFPDQRPGIITISMHKTGEQITLLLADNGVGMGERSAFAKTGSLGLELMKGLSREIHGRIAFANDSGTKITVIFDQGPAFVRQEAGAFPEEKEVYQ